MPTTAIYSTPITIQMLLSLSFSEKMLNLQTTTCISGELRGLKKIALML